MPRKVDFDKASDRLCKKAALKLLTKAAYHWDELSDKEKDRAVSIMRHVLPKKGAVKSNGKKYEDLLDGLK